MAFLHMWRKEWQGKSVEVGSHARASLYYMVENWERHLYGGGQESETHAGRSAAIKMIMASQIMGPHLSSSYSMSNHTTLPLQQPTPSSSHVSVELTRRNCPAAYRVGKAPPSTFKYNYSLCLMHLVEGIVWMDWDHSIFLGLNHSIHVFGWI